MKSSDPLSDFIREESEKKEQLSPQRLKEQINEQKTLNLIHQSEVGKLRARLDFLESQHMPAIVQAATLQEQSREIAALKSQRKEDVQLREQLSIGIGHLQGEVSRLEAEKRTLTESLTKSDDTVKTLMSRLDQFEKRIWGDELPELNFIPEKKDQGGYSFDLVNYPAWGRIWNLSHLKTVLGGRGEYVMSIYDEKVGPSSLATIKLSDLSLDQRLQLIQFGMHDTDVLHTDVPPTMLTPDSAELSAHNKSLTDTEK